jgi:hypothetical protein
MILLYDFALLDRSSPPFLTPGFPCSLQVKFCEYLIAKFFIIEEILFLGDTMQNNTIPSLMEASHLLYMC